VEFGAAKGGVDQRRQLRWLTWHAKLTDSARCVWLFSTLCLAKKLAEKSEKQRVFCWFCYVEMAIWLSDVVV